MNATFAPSSPEFETIVEALDTEPEETDFEALATFRSHEEDLDEQRGNGEKDPIWEIEMVVHWSEEAQQGTIDWFIIRESQSHLEGEKLDEAITFGGSLLGFTYEGAEPDFETLLKPATESLNEQIDWAEFTVE